MYTIEKTAGKRFRAVVLLLLLLIPSALTAQIYTKSLQAAKDSITCYLNQRAVLSDTLKIDTVIVRDGSHIDISFNRILSEYPIREGDLSVIRKIIRSSLPIDHRRHTINITSCGHSIEELVSPYFSGKKSPVGPSNRKKDRWVTRLSTLHTPTKGLEGKIIALWPSHGYYYNEDESRWKWQRAPFFTTIEDLFTQSFVVPYLVPMIENAGGYTTLPRERDFGKEEIIVDNTSPFYTEKNSGKHTSSKWEKAPGEGFHTDKSTLISGENPFSGGDARMITQSKKGGATASYLPYFPKSRQYSVYVSYSSLPASTSSAEYIVRHAGGETLFRINQKIGGGTWVYIGKFFFHEGENGEGVILSNSGNANEVVTTDAVRFGGGMGNISRGGECSGVPRYAEAARYYLQWSGFPPSVYNKHNDKNDYKDDYWSRALWVNFLIKDLGIPVDMAIALHTDAGKFSGDSTVGTLAIYSTVSDRKRHYSDGRSRSTARDLADIIQTQIVEDIRAGLGVTEWNRRGMWDKMYVEARVPETPTLLIEMLSHQNYNDMKLAEDPRFKFIVSRSIYKGILKYLSYIHNTEYKVQPLPVTSFAIDFADEKKGKINISWKKQSDPLEPTAEPQKYILYTQMTDPSKDRKYRNDFDNGRIVTGTDITLTLTEGMLYNFKVTAVNEGGESFPSETLSAGYIPNTPKALIVNGFENTSADTPYLSDYSFTGRQYNFTEEEIWVHDDLPGYGASYMDYGFRALAGNTFDYPSLHGEAFLKSGVSFTSSSLKALTEESIDLQKYQIADFIFGSQESHESMLPVKVQGIISKFCLNGGNIMISGSHTGSVSDNSVPSARGKAVLLDSLDNQLNILCKELNTHASEMDLLRKTLLKANDSIGYNYFTVENSLFDKTIEKSLTAMKGIDSLHSLVREVKENTEKIVLSSDIDYNRSLFAENILKYKYSNPHASSTGEVRLVRDPKAEHIFFHNEPNDHTFSAGMTEALIPADPQARTFLRYVGSNTSAGVAYCGSDYRSVVVGFPLETITSHEKMIELLCEVIDFLSESTDTL